MSLNFLLDTICPWRQQQLPLQLKKDIERDIILRKQKVDKADQFATNYFRAQRAMPFGQYEDILSKFHSFFSKFYEIQSPLGQLFPTIFDAVDFVNQLRPLHEKSFIKVIEKFNTIPFGTLKKLAQKGYTQDELVKIYKLEDSKRIIHFLLSQKQKIDIEKKYPFELTQKTKKNLEDEIFSHIPKTEENEKEISRILTINETPLVYYSDGFQNNELKILNKYSSIIAKFYCLKKPNGKHLFKEIADVIKFIFRFHTLKKGNLEFIEKQQAQFGTSDTKKSDEKESLKYPLEKTIEMMDCSSKETLQKFLLLGYTSDELFSLMQLGKDLTPLAQREKKLSISEAKFLLITGHLNYKRNNKNKALILQAKSDGNEALDPLNNISTYESISARFYTRYRLIKSVNILRDELFKATKTKPQLIIINGHGTQSSLHLGNGRKDLTDSSSLPELFLLKPGTVIILDSCSTGEGKEKEWNLANHLSNIAPHLKIYAATQKSRGFSLAFSKSVLPIFMTYSPSEENFYYYSNPNDFILRRAAFQSKIDYSPDPKHLPAKPSKMISWISKTFRIDRKELKDLAKSVGIGTLSSSIIIVSVHALNYLIKKICFSDIPNNECPNLYNLGGKIFETYFVSGK